MSSGDYKQTVRQTEDKKRVLDIYISLALIESGHRAGSVCYVGADTRQRGSKSRSSCPSLVIRL